MPSPLVRVSTEPLDLDTLEWKFRTQLIEYVDSPPRNRIVNRIDGAVPHARKTVLFLEPSETDSEDESVMDESVMDDSVMDDSDEGWGTHSLKQYLQETWFPAFNVGPRAKQDFVWPHYPELQAAPGTRKLRTISRITSYRIHGFACDYLERQKDKQIARPPEETEDSGDLTLPSINLIKCDDKDVRSYLQDVNFVTDITKLLMAFVFRTVAYCLHTLHDVPEGEVRNNTQFKRSFEMCPVKDKIFDVVSLPSRHPGRTQMIVLVIPPWALDDMDFISFINTGAVTPGSLDVIPTNGAVSAPSIMWALLWDMCSKQNCQYFAVTTYELWAIGNFSFDMQTAYISDLLRAPVHSHDSKLERNMLPSPTMTETLLFWMAACVGAGDIAWKPFGDKIPS